MAVVTEYSDEGTPMVVVTEYSDEGTPMAVVTEYSDEGTPMAVVTWDGLAELAMYHLLHSNFHQ